MEFLKGLLKAAGIILVLLANGAIVNAQPDIQYSKGVAFFKLKPYTQVLTANKTDANVVTGVSWLDAVCTKYSVNSLGQLFYQPVNEESLKRIYKINFPEDLDVMQVVNELAANSDVEYAEPSYIYEYVAMPNDEYYNKQWAHKNMQSEQAWNIQTGSGTVISKSS